MKNLFSTSLLLSLFCSSAFADEQNNAISAEASKQREAKAGKNISDSFFMFREIQGLDLDLTSKDKKASILIKKNRGANSFSLKLTGKFDGSDTEFANQDGLAGDVEGTLAYTMIIDERKVLSDKIAILSARLISSSDAYDSLLTCLQSSNIKDIQREFSIGDNSEDALENCGDEIKKYRATSKTIDNDFSYTYMHTSVTYAPSSFSYYDISNHKKVSSNSEGISTKLAFGIYGESGDIESWYEQDRFEIGAVYSKDDKPSSSNKKQNICKPYGEVAGYSECFDAYLSPTVETKKLIPYISYAMNFTDDPNRWVNGVKFTVRHTNTKIKAIDGDKDTKRFSVKIPVTMFVSSDKKIKAGLSLNWDEKIKTDDEDFDRFTVGFFISSGFDLAGF